MVNRVIRVRLAKPADQPHLYPVITGPRAGPGDTSRVAQCVAQFQSIDGSRQRSMTLHRLRQKSRTVRFLLV